MAVLSSTKLRNLTIMKVSANPNGSISAASGSLARLSNSSAVYKNIGGTSWTLVEDATIIAPLASSGSSDGARGTQGSQGPQGVQGLQGPQGNLGVTGDFGHQGMRGVQGHQGVQGSQGSQGSQGFVGATTGGNGSSGLIHVSSQYVNSATSSVTFSGLNGNSHKEYLLISRIIFVASAVDHYVTLNFNGTPAPDAYVYKIYTRAAGSSNTQGFYDRINKYASGRGVVCLNKTQIRAKSGFARYEYTVGGGYTAGETTFLSDSSTRWSNTTDNLTSLTITGHLDSDASSASIINVGSAFHLYRYEV